MGSSEVAVGSAVDGGVTERLRIADCEFDSQALCRYG